MIDIALIARALGFVITTVGAIMTLPALLELFLDTGQWQPFALASAITTTVGVALILAFQAGDGRGTNQANDPFHGYIIYMLIWLIVPLFGTLPFLLADNQPTLSDAVFESISGFTTTGATIFSDLDSLSSGALLWRALAQWLGGIAVAVLAMTFLTHLRVGGMEIFRGALAYQSGDMLPNLKQTMQYTSIAYLALTLLCGTAYALCGMTPFEATVHAMTTVATGGFGTRDTSFAEFGPAIQYTAVSFMILAAFPVFAYFEAIRNRFKPFIRSSEIHTFLIVLVIAATVMMAWLISSAGRDFEPAFREALFNIVSITTGTGYSSANYTAWGGFAISVFFLVGLVGGCAGSTTCSIKIFRFQILAISLVQEVRLIRNPQGVYTPTYQGRKLPPTTISSVTSFLFLFIASLVTLTALLTLTGLDLITAASGAAATLANIGPGLGPIIGPAGNYSSLPDTAKWLLTAGMILGRMEVVMALVLVQKLLRIH